MHRIVRKEMLAAGTCLMRVEAPQVAAKARAGQFFLLRAEEAGERVPFTFCDWSAGEGWVEFVFLAVGSTTNSLLEYEEGDAFLDVVGPLGNPTETPVCRWAVAGGGVGLAAAYPVARALAEAGGTVEAIVAARSRDLLVLEDKFRAIPNCRVTVMTDDGSYGEKGLVTVPLERLCAAGAIDRVFAVGPVPMMRACSATAVAHGVPVTVSLNPVMLDGTGMCGGCRVEVGGHARFACIDGPDFDGALVDWDDMRARSRVYKAEEERSLELDEAEGGHLCRLRALADAVPAVEVVEPENVVEPEKAAESEKAAAPAVAPVASSDSAEHAAPEVVPATPGPAEKAADRVPAREVDPAERVKGFGPVDLGYTDDDAVLEAGRCLGCKKPACVKGCPVGVDIPRMVEFVKRRDWEGALATVRADNLLPSVCGRVCPQESQCEGACVLGRRGKPLAIGQIERFVGDKAAELDAARPAAAADTVGPAEPFGSVAVVGGGPSGITCALELARMGARVTLFESLHRLGGVLTYGIPLFRLPAEVVDRELAALDELGVRVERDCVVGRTVTVGELLGERGFDAVFIGVGAGLPKMLGIPGENLSGVVCANEYLTRVNLMDAYRFPEVGTPVRRGRDVVVLGGGNVAMDAARTALRLGADSVTLAYRRTEAEMPARRAEVEHAKAEGVRFLELASPLEFVAGENGVASVRFERMRLGEPGPDGRRRPVPLEGPDAVLEVPCDTVVTAIGTNACPLVPLMAPDLRLNARGYIETDENGRTSDPRVWAGGDIVTGAATVILAMGAGKRAAADIARYLRG